AGRRSPSSVPAASTAKCCTSRFAWKASRRIRCASCRRAERLFRIFSGRREGPVLYSEVVDINNKNKLKVLRKVTSGFLPAVGTFKTVQRHGREPDATQ